MLGRIQWPRQGVAGLPEFRRRRVLAAVQLRVCMSAAWRSTRSSTKGIDGVVGSPGARLCHQGEQAKLGSAWLNVHGGRRLRLLAGQWLQDENDNVVKGERTGAHGNHVRKVCELGEAPE